MKSTPAFLMRGLVALTSILLVAGLAFGQDYTQTGTINNSGGTLVIKGTASFGPQTSVSGTVDYAKTTPSQAIADVDYQNLTLSGGSGASKTFPDAEVGVAGNLSLSGGVASSDVDARTGSSAKITYNGSGAQNVAPIEYNNLEFATGGTKTFESGTTKIAGSFTISGGTADATSNSSTVEFDGSGAQSIAGINYHNLSITGTRSGTPAITLASGTIGINGAFAVSPTGAVTYVTTGNTVDYNGTVAQTVTAFDYNGLTVSGARGANNVTLASSGTIGIGGVFSPSATFGGGGYVVTGSTVDYKGGDGQSVIGGSSFALYENLTISGTGTKAASGDIALNASGVLTNSVTFNMDVHNLTFTAAPSNSGTVQFASASYGKPVGSSAGTVEYTGSIAQTVGLGTYYNLAFTNGTATTAEKTITGGTVTANNNVTVNASGFLTVSGTGLLNMTGSLSNSGAITNAGTITVGL